ncbi:unnamed protein product, partial [Prorocentrum cordatum]
DASKRAWVENRKVLGADQTDFVLYVESVDSCLAALAGAIWKDERAAACTVLTRYHYPIALLEYYAASDQLSKHAHLKKYLVDGVDLAKEHMGVLCVSEAECRTQDELRAWWNTTLQVPVRLGKYCARERADCEWRLREGAIKKSLEAKKKENLVELAAQMQLEFNKEDLKPALVEGILHQQMEKEKREHEDKVARWDSILRIAHDKNGGIDKAVERAETGGGASDAGQGGNASVDEAVEAALSEVKPFVLAKKQYINIFGGMAHCQLMGALSRAAEISTFLSQVVMTRWTAGMMKPESASTVKICEGVEMAPLSDKKLDKVYCEQKLLAGKGALPYAVYRWDETFDGTVRELVFHFVGDVMLVPAATDGSLTSTPSSYFRGGQRVYCGKHTIGEFVFDIWMEPNPNMRDPRGSVCAPAWSVRAVQETKEPKLKKDGTQKQQVVPTMKAFTVEESIQ